jgi:hypothetical protein
MEAGQLGSLLQDIGRQSDPLPADSHQGHALGSRQVAGLASIHEVLATDDHRRTSS